MLETNFLIIGSGAAGLTLAVKLGEAFPKKRTTVVTKAHQAESNTKYAQGGVAAVFNLKEDSFQKHIEDTLVAGDGLCDREVVEMVVKDGPNRLKELMEWGANFDVDPRGNLNLGREGGHSEYRVIHHKDSTGNEIERTLLARVENLQNVSLLPHHFAIDLITEHHFSDKKIENLSCYGAYVLDQVSGSVIAIKAESTTLASGGMGMVYGHTTNPVVATGDGVAMAYRAKARIRNMEFIQFHPTALYDGKYGASFLISEAVRGFGAFLRNRKGERFMLDYDERGELASLDIVARGIDFELKNSGEDSVFLDCTHLNIVEFIDHFPNIYKTCIVNNIDISKDWIPVVPASHYMCGGVVVDTEGKTSINNLYACGECSRTGLHGANRLASNSLLEALVYADKIYHYLAENYTEQKDKPKNIFHKNSKKEEVVSNDFIQQKKKEVQTLMLKNAGIVRRDNELSFALKQLTLWKNELSETEEKHTVNKDFYELKNIIDVGLLIIEQSLSRTENKGAFLKITPQLIS